MDGYINVGTNGWMDGRMNKWMIRMQVDKLTDRRMDSCIIGGIDRQFNRYID